MDEWPRLSHPEWRQTYDTVHMWTQVAGKICLALTPLTNHFWNITLRVTPRGLVTPLLCHEGRALTMTFDFIDHAFTIECADGATERIPLAPRTVADFHAAVMAALARLGVTVRIWTTPVEVPNPIPFERDTVHRSYDRAAMAAFAAALAMITPVLERFRGGFIGKSSPVHFFWGSFDLAVTRFSGRRAPERAGADSITREAYSHEVISHGFWLGGGAVTEPAFYAYAAPEPAGFRTASVQPDAAYYSQDLSEFILPYEAVRTAPSPSTALASFLDSTYTAGAGLAGWDRPALERR